jgi:hypothetical protein
VGAGGSGGAVMNRLTPLRGDAAGAGEVSPRGSGARDTASGLSHICVTRVRASAPLNTPLRACTRHRVQAQARLILNDSVTGDRPI